MANRLQVKFTPFGSPGDVEIILISAVEGVTATLAHWKEKVKEATKEDGSNFVEVETEANIKDKTGIVKGSSEAEKFMINVTQVQNVHEY